jgi:lipooligosaccharide transport system ATP-binding protein
MTEPVLRLSGVSRGIVQDVSFDVRSGDVVALVGATGSGKSTVLRLAAGWLRPRGGHITVLGQPVPSLAARRLVGFAPATLACPPGLTVRALLEYLAHFHGPGESHAAMVAAALEFAELGSAAGERPAALPLGMRRRVSLAQAILGGRRVILLDETLDGIDPVIRRRLAERLGRLAWEGTAIVIAAREPHLVERLAERLLVLRAGVIVRDAPAGTLLQERVLEVVLDAPPTTPPPGFRVAPFGVEADLGPRTVEAALAQCRAHRLVVRATRIRSRSLEDVVVESSGGS